MFWAVAVGGKMMSPLFRELRQGEDEDEDEDEKEDDADEDDEENGEGYSE